jgi:hypothetical protein
MPAKWTVELKRRIEEETCRMYTEYGKPAPDDALILRLRIRIELLEELLKSTERNRYRIL